jgi:hypothetical protein
MRITDRTTRADDRLSRALSAILVAHQAAELDGQFGYRLPAPDAGCILARHGFTRETAEAAIVESLGLERVSTVDGNPAIRCSYGQHLILSLIDGGRGS